MATQANEESQKELTAEIHKALVQCQDETVWEAIEQLEQISVPKDSTKEQKMEGIENAILHSFGPQRFVRALESSEKQLNQLHKLYHICKLPNGSGPETLRYVVGVFVLFLQEAHC